MPDGLSRCSETVSSSGCMAASQVWHTARRLAQARAKSASETQSRIRRMQSPGTASNMLSREHGYAHGEAAPRARPPGLGCKNGTSTLCHCLKTFICSCGG